MGRGFSTLAAVLADSVPLSVTRIILALTPISPNKNLIGRVLKPSPNILTENRGAYDAVCAFQVIEHVAKPAQLFAEMAAAAKPGGRVIIGVPHVPSAMSRIPNFLLNAPPHHLTWVEQTGAPSASAAGGLDRRDDPAGRLVKTR